MPIYNIEQNSRGLLMRNGRFVRLLKAKKHYVLPFRGYTLRKVSLFEPFPFSKELAIFLKDPEMAAELDVVEVADHEIALAFEDGLLRAVLKPGRHAFWNVLVKNDFLKIDVRQPEIADDFDRALFSKEVLKGFFLHHRIQANEKGLLFFNNSFVRELGPGQYYFWNGPVAVNIQNVDMRRLQLEMAGQEILTLDKVPIRVNFTCHYRITHPYRASIEIQKHEEQLYVQLQLILREYVGRLNLDEILQTKEEIGNFVLESLKRREEEYGVAFLNAGVKDFILPGHIKDILNQVLKAEKSAQATIITRREETASTRSLLNTAKLMENNPILLRLKELEYVERICQKIDKLSIQGGEPLLTQLSHLLANREHDTK